MRRNEGKKILGTVIVEITSEKMNELLKYFQNERIPLWDIHLLAENKISAHIYYHHYTKLKKLMINEQFEIKTIKKSGLIYRIMRLWRRKEILLSICFVSIAIILLSNTIWQIQIDGISSELEMKLLSKLEEEGIYQGAFTFSIDDVKQIENNLLYSFPDLLFVAIERRGTKFYVRAVEKISEHKDVKRTDQHLIASKSGIVRKMLIKEGQAEVDIYDYVRKGQILVSGLLTKEEHAEESEQEIIIGAEGKVFANTWYEMTVESALTKYYKRLQKPNNTVYYLRFNQYDIPIWGKFWETKPDDEQILITKRFTLFQNTFPLTLVQIYFFEKEQIVEERTLEEAKQVAIQTALTQFQHRLGADSQILKYYILHESVHNGKVRLRLYISALENIAISAPIQ